jgi:hypothetical protein
VRNVKINRNFNITALKKERRGLLCALRFACKGGADYVLFTLEGLN